MKNESSLIMLDRSIQHTPWDDNDYPGLSVSWKHPCSEKVHTFDIEEDVHLFEIKHLEELSALDVRGMLEKEEYVPLDLACLAFFMKTPMHLVALVKKWPAIQKPRLEAISFFGTSLRCNEEAHTEYMPSILFELENVPMVVPFEVHTETSWFHEAIPVFNRSSKRIREQVG